MKYPQIDFNTTLDFVHEIEKKYPQKQVSYDDICDLIHVKNSDNDRFKYNLSAAKQFGLLEAIASRTVNVTNLGKAILYPIDDEKLDDDKIKAFMNSKINEELVQKFNNNNYPTLKVLSNMLVTQYGISSNRSKIAAKCFLNSIDQLKLSNSDNGNSGEDSNMDIEKNIESDNQLDLFKDSEVVDTENVGEVNVSEKIMEHETNVLSSDNCYEMKLPISNNSSVTIQVPVELLPQTEQLKRVKRIIMANLDGLIDE